MNVNDIQTGLRVASQIPLDVKCNPINEEVLKDLGINNNLAYTYHEGMQVHCITEKTKFTWEESLTGLLPISFTYPDNLIVNGIDYSNRTFNFVPTIITKVTAGTNITVSGVGSTVSPYIINSTGGVTAPDATNLVKGILKLTNDLGGTADLPTTPTALHKTTNETFEGIKSSTNTTTPTTNGLALSNSGGSNSESIGISNNGAGRGLYIVNGSSTGAGFYSVNNGAYIGIYAINNSTGRAITTQNFGTGYGIQSINNSSGHGVVSNSMPGAAGFNYIGQDNATDTFTVDKLGNIIANKYTKTGGTAQQILIADGTVRGLNPQKEITTNYTLTNADDGYVIFINNGTTPVSITINTTVTLPNFSVGFIQEGSADISFVGTGVSLTNPIGFKSKGQGYQTFIEKKLSTSGYFLLGNTKV